MKNTRVSETGLNQTLRTELKKWVELYGSTLKRDYGTTPLSQGPTKNEAKTPITGWPTTNSSQNGGSNHA